MYPSPAKESVFIKAKNISEVTLLNIQGELLQSKSNYIKEEEIKLDLKNLNGGLYFLSIKFSDSNIPVTKKIVVQR